MATTDDSRQLYQLMRRCKWAAAARVAERLLREEPDDHFYLVTRGDCDHERFRYASALVWYDRALAVAPACPEALYSRANTLHMLRRDQEAYEILVPLSKMTRRQYERACPDGDIDAAARLADANFLLFMVVACRDASLRNAKPFLDKYFKLRLPRRSTWTLRAAREDVRFYRDQFGD